MSNRFRQGLLASLLACLSANGFAQPSASDTSTNEEPVLIRVYNFARVKPKDLAKAEQVAGRILAHAGVLVDWRDGDPSDPNARTLEFRASSGSRCPGPLRSRELTIQIATAAPVWMPNGALGRALPCARQGILATVFEDRVATVAQHTVAVYHRILGHALAHEIGHVLLQSNEHTNEGLMRGVWSRADWQRAAVEDVGFTRDEVARISEVLAGNSHRAPVNGRSSPQRHLRYLASCTKRNVRSSRICRSSIEDWKPKSNCSKVFRRDCIKGGGGGHTTGDDIACCFGKSGCLLAEQTIEPIVEDGAANLQ